MSQRVHVIVRGVVQGVGFRMTAQRQASHLGLQGYVRNLPDGTVEIVAEGPANAIDRLLAWASHGPPGAVVDDISVEKGAAIGEFGAFSVHQ